MKNKKQKQNKQKQLFLTVQLSEDEFVCKCIQEKLQKFHVHLKIETISITNRDLTKSRRCYRTKWKRSNCDFIKP